MAMTQQQYFSQLKALLPRGILWDSLVENELGDLLQAQAVQLARVDARADDLINEADPRTAIEMLPEWEDDYGLPDGCIAEELTLAQRHETLHSKVTSSGGQSRAFFIALAAQLGYVITITEYSIHNVDSSVDDEITDESWIWLWRINAPTVTVYQKTVDSGVDEALSTWGNERLECAMNRLKPAHTRILFSYTGD